MKHSDTKLRITRIAQIKLNIPSKNEQNMIASFFSIIEEKINKLIKQRDKIIYFKKGLLQQIFTQKLQFKKEKSIFNLNKWGSYNLGDLCLINKGFTPSTKNLDYWDGNIPWLSIADMKQGKYIHSTSKKITSEGTLNKKIIKSGTLIMSFKLTIGKLGILKKDMYTNEAICNFQWKNNKINTEYMYYYLSSINILRYGSQAAKGITLNNDTLKSIPIKLPHLEEQEKIVNFLSAIDKKIDLIKLQIDRMEEFKKGLLQQMFI